MKKRENLTVLTEICDAMERAGNPLVSIDWVYEQTQLPRVITADVMAANQDIFQIVYKDLSHRNYRAIGSIKNKQWSSTIQRASEAMPEYSDYLIKQGHIYNDMYNRYMIFTYKFLRPIPDDVIVNTETDELMQGIYDARFTVVRYRHEIINRKYIRRYRDFILRRRNNNDAE